MNSRHRKTYDAIFQDPVRSNVLWSDCEGMLRHLGAAISEGSGSRIRIELNGADAVFHRPHPQKETDRGALKSLRRLLNEAGAEPDGPKKDSEEEGE